MQFVEQFLDSREVAEMVETEHWQLLRKLDGRTDKNGKHIKGYIEVINDNHLVAVDYFIPSTYKDAKGEERPCYRITKLGCDFLANKFTGEKGIIFTARYVKRFHEMEEQLQRENHMDWFVNDIRVFQHREFGILRTLKLDGQDYFIGQDVTRALGYVNNNDTLKKRVSDSEKCYVGICDGTRSRKMVAITLKGLNELIQTGRLPLADKYNEWIQRQVVPVLSDKPGNVPVTYINEERKSLDSKKAEKKGPYDIAPAFREIISMLPLEALDAMEHSFRGNNSLAIRLAALSILTEKMKRRMN